MKRSPGVTFSAVTALIGSILTFLVGLVMVAVMMFAPLPATGQTPMSPAFMRGMFVALSLFYLVPAVWGIATGIGLLRLRNWARISIIVFSVLLVLTGLFAGLVSLLMPTPAGVGAGASAAATLGVKIGIAVFWLAQLGIGVWWLIFFTRSKVKVQFVPAQVASTGVPTPPMVPGAVPTSTLLTNPTGSPRPLSITIIAWFLLIGSLVFPLNLLFHYPVLLFTSLVTGWIASLIYLGYAVVHLFVGSGLLKLRPWARQVAIGLYAFGFVNTAIFYFAPGSRGRVEAFLESQNSMFWWEKMLPNQPQVRMDPAPLFPVFAVIGLIGVAVPIYFLVTRKAAFVSDGE